MPKANVPLLSFNGGAVSPLALARVDVERLRLSAEEMTNWLPKTQGPMRFRPGLRYLGASRNNGSAQFIDFVASTTDTALLELTSGAMRIWKDDALLATLDERQRPLVARALAEGGAHLELGALAGETAGRQAAARRQLGPAMQNVMRLLTGARTAPDIEAAEGTGARLIAANPALSDAERQTQQLALQHRIALFIAGRDARDALAALPEGPERLAAPQRFLAERAAGKGPLAHLEEAEAAELAGSLADEVEAEAAGAPQRRAAARQAAIAEGLALAATGGVTADWIAGQGAVFSRSDRRAFRRLAAGDDAPSDPAIAHAFLMRDPMDPDDGDAVLAAFGDGQLSRADLLRFTTPVADPADGGSRSNARRLLRLRMPPPEPTPAGRRDQFRTVAAFDDWLQAHPEADDDAIAGKLAQTLQQHREARLAALPVPRGLGRRPRSAADVDRAVQATIRGFLRRGLSRAQMAAEARLLGQYRRTIDSRS